jgi:hypothetical protein
MTEKTPSKKLDGLKPLVRRTTRRLAMSEAKTPFNLVCDMEDDVFAIRGFAHVVNLISESLDDPNDAHALQLVAWEIKSRAETVEEQRAKLFHTLHPHRLKSVA